MKSMDDKRMAAFLLENFGCNKIIDCACRFCTKECLDDGCTMSDEEIVLKWLESDECVL